MTTAIFIVVLFRAEVGKVWQRNFMSKLTLHKGGNEFKSRPQNRILVNANIF